jgi:hypothetical protein
MARVVRGLIEEKFIWSGDDRTFLMEADIGSLSQSEIVGIVIEG